jgi:hypothetical protein
VKLIQSGLDKRNSTFRIPLLKFLFLSPSLCLSQFRSPFSLAALRFLILLQMANQRGKEKDFVGILMGWLMLEVAEELRDVPF